MFINTDLNRPQILQHTDMLVGMRVKIIIVQRVNNLLVHMYICNEQIAGWTDVGLCYIMLYGHHITTQLKSKNKLKIYMFTNMSVMWWTQTAKN
jgi:hypothetical protein